MKKSLVAVSIIVALGAVWTGASWYTGKQLENRLDGFIAKANTKLKESLPERGMEWQAKDFNRGIFSSDVRLILTIKGGIEKMGIKPNEEIIFKSTIDHGPFPITKAFSLMPKMASIHSELEQSDALKAIFDLTGGKSPFKLDANVSYGGTLSTDMDLLPITHTETKENGEQRVLSFSGAKIIANVNRDLSAFSFSVKNDGLSFSEPNKKETISLKGIDFKGDHKKGNFDIYVGDQSYSIGEFSINGIPNEPNISLKGIKITSNANEDKENLNIKVAYGIDGVNIKDIEFGSGQLNLGIEKLDGQSVRKFTQAYNDATQEALATSELSDDTVTYAVMSNLHLLMNKDPQFSISPFSWKNSKGESSVDFNLALQNVPEDKNSMDNMKPEDMIRTLVKELSLDVNIPKAMLIESIAQSRELAGQDKTAAENQAKQQVQFLVAGGNKFITDKDNLIGLNFHYANDKVKLNGKESNLHQFLLDNNLVGTYDDADSEQSQHDNDAELPVTE
ncbi:conserved exported protein of unknown function [Xenorhabdus poinarii G6]|uniref:Protein ydgA n=1 Tax=Xenorhabdus poinarii G6 TaxID=1354304 RepID=A0A068R251_9GAMM|nr:YdgA family protein [Xenorhabdus poinarii]CDG21352.1 conserved exported protein of unknown function [Xenorhabdus poinarii G6]